MRMYHEENSVNRHEDDIYHVGKELRAWCYYWYVATSGELQTKPRYYSRLQCSKTPNVLMMSCYLCEISTAIPSESHPWAYIKWIDARYMSKRDWLYRTSSRAVVRMAEAVWMSPQVSMMLFRYTKNQRRIIGIAADMCCSAINASCNGWLMEMIDSIREWKVNTLSRAARDVQSEGDVELCCSKPLELSYYIFSPMIISSSDNVNNACNNMCCNTLRARTSCKCHESIYKSTILTLPWWIVLVTSMHWVSMMLELWLGLLLFLSTDYALFSDDEFDITIQVR